MNILLLIISILAILSGLYNLLPKWNTFFIAFGFSMGATRLIRIREISKSEKSTLDK